LACKGITKRGSIPERYPAKGATDEQRALSKTWQICSVAGLGAQEGL